MAQINHYSPPHLVLPRPLTPGHYDFADVLADRACAICGDLIGHGKPFRYVTPMDKALVHATCAEKQLSKQVKEACKPGKQPARCSSRRREAPSV